MAYDAHKDLAVSTIATAPSPATSGATCAVATGHGSRFPTPPFDVTICDSTASWLDPTNSEIARVTAMSGDSITAMTRNVYGLGARTVIVGDRIVAGLTAAQMQAIEANTCPFVIQRKYSGTAITSVVLDHAPVSGHTLIMLTNATTGQVSAVTQTGVTWTQIKTLTSGGSSFYAIWVGVVGAGASATITMTKPGSFNTVLVAEVSDKLVGTIGAFATGSSSAGEFSITGLTGKRLIVFGSGQDNTTLNGTLFPPIVAAGKMFGVNMMALGYVPVGVAELYMPINPGGAGGYIFCEIT